MKTLIVCASLLAAGGTARAQDTFAFAVEGHRVNITIHKHCHGLSCVGVSLPGLKFGHAALDRRAADDEVATATPVVPAAPTPKAIAPEPVASVATIVAPAATPPVAGEDDATATQRPPVTPTPAPTPAPAPAVASTAPIVTGTTVIGTAPARPETKIASIAPATAPEAKPQPPIEETSPIGIWMTEKHEGRVHIVACGDRLCGYAFDERTKADGARVLIDMKQVGARKWSGRIHDTRGGGTYDSTIALNGATALRVQGCAFGGLFCGGQTWTRL